MLPSERAVTDQARLQLSERVAALRPSADVVQREMYAQIRGALFAAPADPVMIGRYMVLERRGAGGMGTVFAAWDRALQRRVAVKVLHRSHARDREEAILREARVLARVTDPHVVAIFDVGRDGDDSWIAMEYVDGVEIGKAVQEPTSTGRLALWLAQAASGIAAAHAGGVVHGDIKPSNILVTSDGRARVVDFGMATVVGAARIVGGTAGYLAPELAVGGPPTPSADTFALCVTANELRARQARGPWRGRLARVIARGLDPSPSARPTMEALATAFRAVAHRRRDRTRSAIVLGLGIAAIAATWPSAAQTECELPVAPRWDGELRARAEAALVAAGDDGARAWTNVAPVLDARAIAWTEARDAACTRASTTGSSVTSCLAARDAALEDLVDSLERRQTAPRGDQILAAAGDAGGCTEEHDALAVYDDDLRFGLVRVQVAKALGDFPRALELSRDLWEEARREGSRRDALRVAFELGDLRALAGEPDAAHDLLAHVYFGAIAEDDDELALHAAIASLRLASRTQLDLDDAEYWRRALLSLLARVDPPRALRVRAVDVLARHAQRRGDWGEARRLTESIVDTPEAEHDDPIVRVRIGMLHAGILRHEGDAAGQLAVLQRTAALAMARHPPDHPDIGATQTALGSALDDVGRTEEAIVALRDGIAMLERAHLYDRVADPHYDLGRALFAAGELDEAERHYERSLELFARVRGPDHPDGVLPHIGLAEVAEARGDSITARTHYDRALVLSASRPGERAHVLFAIGQLELGAGTWDAAIARYREAREVFAQPGGWRVMLVETWVGEARALAGRGDRAAARIALGRARELAEEAPALSDYIPALDEIAATLR